MAKDKKGKGDEKKAKLVSKLELSASGTYGT
jgi:hypothetical protein